MTPVPLSTAVARGKRVAELAAVAEPIEQHGGKREPAQELNPETEPEQGYRDKRITLPSKEQSQRGVGADYLTRRIARDAPEVLERMKAGEFPSVRAAARRFPCGTA